MQRRAWPKGMRWKKPRGRQKAIAFWQRACWASVGAPCSTSCAFTASLSPIAFADAWHRACTVQRHEQPQVDEGDPVRRRERGVYRVRIDLEAEGRRCRGGERLATEQPVRDG